MRFFISIQLAFVLSGCIPVVVDSPPSDDYETWKKAGSNSLDIWKVMLECGYASPFRPREKFSGGYRTEEEVTDSMLCIQSMGYVKSVDGKVSPVCDGFRKNLLPCRDGFKVRKPSVSVRLNSGYCKSYPKSIACVS
ncbi:MULTISPECIES: hypothetical protein [unclassified Xanthomonas]|uniref:hypothetical protein n=1 Tax=unclassified Xanthomonas TaxID=2643310 RepID=UPI0028830E7F|nr:MULTISPECIES: hypothetical protein [unclassified Xanthomonas]MEA9565128.1 hypothetical protein [Xanthomonas sp. WHRI 8932A]